MPYGDDDNDEKRAGDVAPEGKRVTGRSEQESRRRRAGLQGVRAAAGADVKVELDGEGCCRS